MYLSSKYEDVISLALVATSPLPVAPVVSAGGEIGGTWWSETGAGIFRRGCVPQGSYSFTPLFVLKRIRKQGKFPFRSVPPEQSYADDDIWEDVDGPWAPLNEDGEEEPFVDTVYD
ncbi:hypothetical protein B0H10DRAFT_1210619 [Mycena sp. CBHHK59/15]|nr:hypothetical protein B0H10DRAFT_1210619 [Mycena sp. CBHHK59/15]